jgi:hypothetical protein
MLYVNNNNSLRRALIILDQGSDFFVGIFQLSLVHPHTIAPSSILSSFHSSLPSLVIINMYFKILLNEFHGNYCLKADGVFTDATFKRVKVGWKKAKPLSTELFLFASILSNDLKEKGKGREGKLRDFGWKLGWRHPLPFLG